MLKARSSIIKIVPSRGAFVPKFNAVSSGAWGLTVSTAVITVRSLIVTLIVQILRKKKQALKPALILYHQMLSYSGTMFSACGPFWP